MQFRINAASSTRLIQQESNNLLAKVLNDFPHDILQLIAL